MLQRNFTRSTRLLGALALGVMIPLAGCSEDSTPILANQSGPSASPKSQTEIQSTATGLSRDRSSDPLLGMVDGDLYGSTDSIKLDNTPLLDTITITVIDTVIIRDTLLIGELQVDTVFVTDTVCP